MSNINERKKYVIRILGNDFIPVEGSSELRYQCHFCEEEGRTYEDYKLYVNYFKGMYFCQRCEATGNIHFDDLMVQGTVTEVYDPLVKYMKELVSGESGIVTDELDESDYFLIPLTKPIPDTLAWDYLIERGISPIEMDYYSIRVPYSSTDDAKLRGRIIIPNRLIKSVWTDMYTARSYINHKVRYKNPRSSKKNHIVFNLHRILQNPERLIINEGPINSIIAGVDSIGTYGKHVSEYQLSYILDKNPKTIYVSFDTDAMDKAEELCSRIKSRNSDSRVFLIELPEDKDASDLGKAEYMNYVNSAKEYVSKSIFEIENAILKFLE